MHKLPNYVYAIRCTILEDGNEYNCLVHTDADSEQEAIDKIRDDKITKYETVERVPIEHYVIENGAEELDVLEQED